MEVPEDGEGLTGRLEYRENTLSNGGGLPKWSFSSVLHAHDLEPGVNSTP